MSNMLPGYVPRTDTSMNMVSLSQTSGSVKLQRRKVINWEVCQCIRCRRAENWRLQKPPSLSLALARTASGKSVPAMQCRSRHLIQSDPEVSISQPGRGSQTGEGTVVVIGITGEEAGVMGQDGT